MHARGVILLLGRRCFRVAGVVGLAHLLVHGSLLIAYAAEASRLERTADAGAAHHDRPGHVPHPRMTSRQLATELDFTRTLGRFCLERRDVTLAAVRVALDALERLPAFHEESMRQLRRLAR